MAFKAIAITTRPPQLMMNCVAWWLDRPCRLRRVCFAMLSSDELHLTLLEFLTVDADVAVLA